MSLGGNDIRIIISASNEASKTMKEVESDAKSSFGNIGGSIRGVVEDLALFDLAMRGLERLTEPIKAVWDEMEQLQSVAAQTAAVLKSTGDASGVTAEQVSKLAESLEGASTYSQAAIQAGENILLTFRNIGGSVLPQTTQAVMDMATAMHMDLNSAALQVGKALEDPIGGLTRLQRAGVQFTQAQKDQIKSLVDTGQGMAAQKIILDELANEFGGSAAAQAKTFGGALDQLKNEALTGLANFMNSNVLPHLLDFEQVIQSQVLPALKAWASNDLLPKLQQFGSFLQSTVLPVLKEFGTFITGTVIPALHNFWDDSLEPKIEAFASFITGTVIPALQSLANDVLPTVKQVLSDIGDWMSSNQDVIAAFAVAVGIIAVAFAAASIAGAILAGVFAVITSPVLLTVAALAAVGAAVYEIIQNWDELTAKFPALQQGWTDLQQAVSQVEAWFTGTLVPNLKADWDKISSDMSTIADSISQNWNTISTIISTVLGIIEAEVGVVFGTIVNEVQLDMNVLRDVINIVTALIHGDWQGAWNGIKQVVIDIWNSLVSEAGTILGGIEGAAGAVWDAVGDAAATAWNNIVHTVQEGAQACLDAIASMVHGIGNALSTLSGISIGGGTMPSFDTGIPGIGTIGGGSIPSVSPFSGLAGAASALQGWAAPTADFSGANISYTRSGGGKGGGGGPAYVGSGGMTPEQAIAAAGGASTLYSPLDDGTTLSKGGGGGSTDTADPMSGAGAGDFSPGKGAGGGGGGGKPKGGGGGGGGGAPSDATQATDMNKVWKDLHDAADAYQKALDGIKDTQPKLTQALLDSEKAMRPQLVDAMTTAYQNYQTAAAALAAGVAGGASAKDLSTLSANLSGAKDQFTAAAKDVTDLDTKINTDTKALHDQRVAEVNDMGNAIITALKAQAADQLQTEKDSIAAQKDALKQGTADAVQAFTDRKKAADDAYAQQLQDAKDAQAQQFQVVKDGLAQQQQAQKDALSLQQQLQTNQFDAATNAKIASIQAQIDAPAIKANLDKEAALRLAISHDTGSQLATDQASLDSMLVADHNKVLQGQITDIKTAATAQKQQMSDEYKLQNQALADQQKTQTQTLADAQKTQAQSLTDHYADEKKASDKRYDDLIKAARDNETATNKVLDDQLKSAEAHYKDQTTNAKLQADARLMIEGGNQQDIVKLLNKYDPDWNTAGKNLGQQLIDGLKQSDIPGAVERIFADMGSGSGGTTSDKAAKDSAGPSEGRSVTIAPGAIVIQAWDANSVLNAVPQLLRALDVGMQQGGGLGLSGVGALKS